MQAHNYYLSTSKSIKSVIIHTTKLENKKKANSRKRNCHYEGQLVAGYQRFQVKPVWHMVNSSTSNRTGTVKDVVC